MDGDGVVLFVACALVSWDGGMDAEREDVPRTMPPFQRTKAINVERITKYGAKAWRVWGRFANAAVP